MMGMRQLLFVCLFLVTIDISPAFIFDFVTRRQTAKRPVDEECVALARSGDCRFYRCFDDRHPCTNTNGNYAVNYSSRVCSRFDVHYEQLTAHGKRWLNGTRQCVMERMLDLYRLDALSCSEVDAEMRDRQAACEAENGLCQGRMLVENKDIFSAVYALNRHSAVHFLESVKQCALAKFREVATWFREHLHSAGEIGQSVLPVFQDVEQQLRQLKDNIQGEFNRLRATFQRIRRVFGAKIPE